MELNSMEYILKINSCLTILQKDLYNLNYAEFYFVLFILKNEFYGINLHLTLPPGYDKIRMTLQVTRQLHLQL